MGFLGQRGFTNNLSECTYFVVAVVFLFVCVCICMCVCVCVCVCARACVCVTAYLTVQGFPMTSYLTAILDCTGFSHDKLPDCTWAFHDNLLDCTRVSGTTYLTA